MSMWMWQRGVCEHASEGRRRKESTWRGERAKSAQDTGVVCERARGGAFDFESDGVPELGSPFGAAVRAADFRLKYTKCYMRHDAMLAHHTGSLSTSALFGLAALAARHTRASPRLKKVYHPIASDLRSIRVRQRDTCTSRSHRACNSLSTGQKRLSVQL